MNAERNDVVEPFLLTSSDALGALAPSDGLTPPTSSGVSSSPFDEDLDLLEKMMHIEQREEFFRVNYGIVRGSPKSPEPTSDEGADEFVEGRLVWAKLAGFRPHAGVVMVIS